MTLKACCQKIVDQYLTLFNPPRERAALYCPDCKARIVCRGGAWTTEWTNII